MQSFSYCLKIGGFSINTFKDTIVLFNKGGAATYIAICFFSAAILPVSTILLNEEVMIISISSGNILAHSFKCDTGSQKVDILL